MKASQFEQGYTASVFFRWRAVPGHNFRGAFAPDDAVPQ
jgi:hypothetical protein